MDELLKKLLAAEVLTEETKKELESALKKQLDEAVTKAKDEAAADVRAQLHEQWITERDALISALDDKVTAFLVKEMKELKDDIERFRDLEAESAEKIVEAKAGMAAALKSDMATLVEKLDAFLEVRLTAELDELREDIQEVKKNEFGRKIYEAYQAEFKKFADEDTVEGKLNETEEQLTQAVEELKEAQQELASYKREKKLAEVLKPLQGRSREVMEAILKNVNTDMLEEAYKTYIGRVLKEAVTPTATPVVESKKATAPAAPAEKETKVLAEGDKKVTKGAPAKAYARTGDKSEALDERVKLETETSSSRLSEGEMAWFQKIAGVVKQ